MDHYTCSHSTPFNNHSTPLNNHSTPLNNSQSRTLLKSSSQYFPITVHTIHTTNNHNPPSQLEQSLKLYQNLITQNIHLKNQLFHNHNSPFQCNQTLNNTSHFNLSKQKKLGTVLGHQKQDNTQHVHFVNQSSHLNGNSNNNHNQNHGYGLFCQINQNQSQNQYQPCSPKSFQTTQSKFYRNQSSKYLNSTGFNHSNQTWTQASSFYNQDSSCCYKQNDIALWSMKQRNNYLEQKLQNLQHQYLRQESAITKAVNSEKWQNRMDCKENTCYHDKYIKLLRVKSPVLLD